MQTQKEQDSFHYTYSAKEQEELKRIRQKYQPQEEDKMEKLRRMDADVTKKATMISLASGIIGALVLGIGMSLSMTDIGESLGLVGAGAMAAGTGTGLVGIVLVCIAYPAYTWIIKREREKIAPEILKLTDELMK